MNKYYKLVPLLLIALLVSACTPVYTHHDARKIVFKTPQLSYADVGFIHDNGKAMKIEILVVGHPAFTLELGNKICLDGYCFKKKEFIKKYLNASYDEAILHRIFLGQTIFNKEGYRQESDGFSQTIFKKNNYQIIYNVSHDTIRFKDTISKILIKTQKLEQ